MFNDKISDLVYNSMSELRDLYSVENFVISYIEHLKDSGVKNYIENAQEIIYVTLLNHKDYQSIKNIWHPFPSKDYILKKLRQNKIDNYLYTNI